MISIITAYYNRKELFRRTLESIKRQPFPEDLEVIAIDDGSSKAEQIEDFISEFPFLKIIRIDPENKWYQNSCIPFNIGFKEAKGDKIIIQNPECLHFGNIISYVSQNLKNNTYLSFSCFSLDKNITDHLDEFLKTPKKIEKHIEKHSHIVKKDGDLGWYNHSVYRPKAYHFCTAITKKDLNDLGGFSELLSLGIAFDDNDLIWRIKRKGMIINFVDEEVVLHQNHYNLSSTSYQNRKNKEILFENNKKIFHEIIVKNGFQANRILKNIPFKQKKIFTRFFLFLLKFKNHLKYLKKNFK